MLAESERLEFYGYPADYLETYKAALEKVTLADVNAAAKKYIHPDKLAVLVVGNGPEIKPPLDDLGMGAPHPIDITIPQPRRSRRQPGAGAEQLSVAPSRPGIRSESSQQECAHEDIAELVARDARRNRRPPTRLMAAGVTIYRPETCVIDAEVEVGAGHRHRALCAIARHARASAPSASSAPTR